jgi:hypothetical protein
MDRWKSCEKCQAWEEGLCKRHPPILVSVAVDGGGWKLVSRWPETGAEDWCGDWLPHKLGSRNGE